MSIATVENTRAEWKAAASQIVEDIALTNQTFTTDLVWNELSNRGFDVDEHRLLGGIMTKAVKDGLVKIEDCNHCGTVKVMTKSLREEAHKMDVAVYRSLVYGQI